MLTSDLFDTVLIEPAKRYADTLYIVSGYASASMVSRHFTQLSASRLNQVRIELIVGMAASDGIFERDHEGFQQFTMDYGGRFACYYVAHGSPVHTKTYAWCRGDELEIAFTGSANYSQAAFGTSRREALIQHDAQDSLEYYDLIRQDAISCTDLLVKDHIKIHTGRRAVVDIDADVDDVENGTSLSSLPNVRLDFLNSRGELKTRRRGEMQRSWLNWGQRPEEGREPNQAYLGVPANIGRTGFFPPRGEHFTVQTDDGKFLILARVQDNAKGLQTPSNNSWLGVYFRRRLGVPEGEYVPAEAFHNYGRSYVDFYKIDEENYYMDFSAP